MVNWCCWGIRFLFFIHHIGCRLILSQLFFNFWSSTGGSGFLGQHIVKLLQECDPLVKEIRVLDLRPYENKLGEYRGRRWMMIFRWPWFISSSSIYTGNLESRGFPPRMAMNKKRIHVLIIINNAPQGHLRGEKKSLGFYLFTTSIGLFNPKLVSFSGYTLLSQVSL